jgi:choline transport protein
MVLNNPDYVPERWHATLLTIAIVVLASLINIFATSQLPLLEGLILVLHVFGFFAIIIPLWVLSPRNSAARVFTEFSDGGGWGSLGTACIVGQICAITSFIGADSAVHMCKLQPFVVSFRS